LGVTYGWKPSFAILAHSTFFVEDLASVFAD
jgi:hypothetical protein